MNNTTNSKRIAKNSFYLYFRTFFSIIVTLYTSRVFLNQLGIEDYGIYNLVGGVVALFSVLNSLMASATQRFLSIEIGNDNTVQMHKILNISISLHILILIAFVVIGEVGGLLLLYNYLSIPEGKETITCIVFHLSILTAAITFVRVPYNALIIAKERMSFFAYISIFEVLLKLVVTLSLVLFSSKLVVFSVLQLAVTILITLLYFYYSKKYIGLPRYHNYKFNGNPEYKSLLSFSTWSLIGSSSSVARDQGLTFLLNRYLGVVLNAAMGVMVQISNVYSSLFLNLQSAFRPQIIQSSVNDRHRYQRLLNICAFYSLAMMGFVCIPMIIACKIILTAWLGIVPDYSVEFVQILMIKIILASVSQCVFLSLEAFSKIRDNQLFTAVLSAMVIIISFLMLRIGIEPYLVISTVVLMELSVLIHRLVQAHKLACMDCVSFIKYNGGIFSIALVLSIIALFLSNSDNFYTVFLRTFLTVLIYVIAILALMEKRQKQLIIEKIKTIL